MILYSVTVSIDPEIEQSWLKWMKEVHVPDVLATGLIHENRILRLMNEEEGGSTYNFQYYFSGMDSYHIYQKEYAEDLQKDHSERYKGKFAAFRTLLEVVE
jgi:hypothetical protein